MSKLCMLAHTYDPEKHTDKKIDGYWISEKYDGIRGIWDGKNMKSRNGKIYTIPSFFRQQLRIMGTKLDGEIWFGLDTFDIASGAARRDVNDDEVWKNMTYMVFDTPDTDNTLQFEDRMRVLQDLFDDVKDHVPNIKLVKYRKFKSGEMNIGDELLKVENNGGEGLMLRRPKSLYVFDRSHDMLKVKSWVYKECEVVGYVEGTGRLEGMVGSLEVKSNDLENEEGEVNCVLFKIGSGLNDVQRFSGGPDDSWRKESVQKFINDSRIYFNKNIIKDEKKYKDLVHTVKNSKGREKIDALHKLNEVLSEIPIIGSIVTFRYKELTKNGIPKFPTFVGIRNYE